MYEIYTPKEWTRVLGGTPQIIIDDEGYIYDHDDYYKIIKGAPRGYINYKTGKIYGPDYANFSPAPIGEIRVKDDVTEIYGEDYYKLSAAPILYIKNGKIYTADDYFKIFTGGPSGYVKDPDKHWKEKEAEKKRQEEEYKNEKRQNTASNVAGCLDSEFGCGAAVIALFAIVIAVGNAFDSLANNPLPIIIFAVVAVIFIIIRFKRKKADSGSSGTKTTAQSPFEAVKNKSTAQKTSTAATKNTTTAKKPSAGTSYKVYTYKCDRCGKNYTSYQQNPSSKYCDKCRMEIMKEKKTQTTANKTTNTAAPKSTAPKTTTTNKTSSSNTSKTSSTPMNYAHSCPQCGKSFVNTKQYPKSMLCDACSNKAKAQEKKPATQKCKVCGKEFPAYVNKSTGICMECTAKAQETKKEVKAPVNNVKTSSTPMVYAHDCPKCGKKFTNTTKLPKEMLCEACIEKEKAEKAKQEVNTSETKATPKMTVYSCPKCGAKNKGPVGVGKITMTCGNPECKHKFTIET